jgi:hypothetical protein
MQNTDSHYRKHAQRTAYKTTTHLPCISVSYVPNCFLARNIDVNFGSQSRHDG